MGTNYQQLIAQLPPAQAIHAKQAYFNAMKAQQAKGGRPRVNPFAASVRDILAAAHDRDRAIAKIVADVDADPNLTAEGKKNHADSWRRHHMDAHAGNVTGPRARFDAHHRQAVAANPAATLARRDSAADLIRVEQVWTHVVRPAMDKHNGDLNKVYRMLGSHADDDAVEAVRRFAPTWLALNGQDNTAAYVADAVAHRLAELHPDKAGAILDAARADADLAAAHRIVEHAEQGDTAAAWLLAFERFGAAIDAEAFEPGGVFAPAGDAAPADSGN